MSEEVCGKHEIDRPRIERAVREILIAIGDDPEREGVLGTPERVADAYAYLFAGLGENPTRHLEVGFMESARDTVLVRDIPLASYVNTISCRSLARPTWGMLPTAGSSGSPSWRGSSRVTLADLSYRSG